MAETIRWITVGLVVATMLVAFAISANNIRTIRRIILIVVGVASIVVLFRRLTERIGT